MIYFYFDTIDYTTDVVIRHIIQRTNDGGTVAFPLTNNNPNKAAYEAWIAEGNTAEEWNPDTVTEPVTESEPVVEEPTIEEAVSEPVIEESVEP